ncbi:hypothetical protein DL768_004669 [Monosporascus sp. mg162]|nr:hypothetical protein DL768_004669 [Monosporascus sp. mg162]
MDASELTFDLVPEGGHSGFHLLNVDDDDFRRVWAQTTNGSSPLSVRVKLAELHHGKIVYEEEICQATLLLFEIRFESSLQERRYKSAKVTLEFFDRDGKAKQDPHVVRLAPDKMHWLNKTTYDKTTSRGASLGVQAGAEVAGAEATVQWDVEYTKPKKFKATLTGKPHHSEGRRPHKNENAVTWTMQENKDECDGVPSFLQTAVLLKRTYNVPFFARLRIKSNVDFATLLRRALPFTTDQDKTIDPVVFMPGNVQVRDSSITGITEADLKHMHKLPVSSYFKVNLSEQDPLTPPTAELLEAAPKLGVVAQPTSAAEPTFNLASPASLGTLTEEVGQSKSVSSELLGCSAGLSVVEAANKVAEAAQTAARAAASAVEATKIAKAAAEAAALAAAEAALIAANAEKSALVGL